jgi:hypothetical protein
LDKLYEVRQKKAKLDRTNLVTPDGELAAAPPESP